MTQFVAPPTVWPPTVTTGDVPPGGMAAYSPVTRSETSRYARAVR